MALTKEQLLKRRLNSLIGYNEGKNDLQDLVNILISCINAEGKENVSNENSVKLVQQSIHSFASNQEDLQNTSFYEELVRKIYNDDLLVTAEIAEKIAILMFDQFSKNKEQTGVNLTGQEILNILSDETYQDLINRIRSHRKGKLKLSDLVDLKEPYAFAENVLTSDLESIEKTLGWNEFPLDYGSQAIISWRDFYINFDATFKWIISNDDTSAKVVVESEIKTIKEPFDSFESIHLCINGEIWTGYDLSDAIKNFMSDCELYDPYTAVQVGIIDESEIDYYYNEPQEYVAEHYGINKDMPRKYFKAFLNFQSSVEMDNLLELN